MDDGERLLRDYTRACEEVTRLECELETARADREALKKEMRAAMRAPTVDGDGGPEPSTARSHTRRKVQVQENAAHAARAVREIGRPVGAADLATALRISVEQARNRLLRASAAGLLTRERRGRYVAAPEDAPPKSVGPTLPFIVKEGA